jgi:hypothetical protein
MTYNNVNPREYAIKQEDPFDVTLKWFYEYWPIWSYTNITFYLFFFAYKTMEIFNKKYKKKQDKRRMMVVED